MKDQEKREIIKERLKKLAVKLRCGIDDRGDKLVIYLPDEKYEKN